MKRSYSYDALETLNKNKRAKRSIPPLKPVTYLKCDICQTLVSCFGQCINAFVFCSQDCLEILTLRKLNEMRRTSFDQDEDDLMLM